MTPSTFGKHKKYIARTDSRLEIYLAEGEAVLPSDSFWFL